MAAGVPVFPAPVYPEFPVLRREVMAYPVRSVEILFGAFRRCVRVVSPCDRPLKNGVIGFLDYAPLCGNIWLRNWCTLAGIQRC